MTVVKIEIYSTRYCPFCDRAKQLLDNKSIPYTEIFVDTDPEKMQEMLSRTQGKRSVPQIFINDQGIGGFDDLRALEHSGELDKLLQN